MSAPRLEFDLEKIHHNARTLVERLGKLGISVTGVTKAALGFRDLACTLVDAGVHGLADSRIENIEVMRRAGVAAPMTLIRSPMLSQVARVVQHADVSFNTELEVVAALSRAGQVSNRTHGVVLMVELGDLREGIMPADLERTVLEVLRLPRISLRGLGTNLACRSGVSPGTANMSEFSAITSAIEKRFGRTLEIVSGGNSANLDWAFSGEPLGRVNNLRLGESILIGCEPLRRRAIEGLHTDAITLVAEVIETQVKPSSPWGDIAQAAFGETRLASDRGIVPQSILALGHQDIDPLGLHPPSGIEILGASSDHLVVSTGSTRLPVGAEVTFGLDYGALLRATTSPFVAKVVRPRTMPTRRAIARAEPARDLVLV